jgi:hypothetical protein
VHQLPKTLRLTNFAILLAVEEFLALIPLPGLAMIWTLMSTGFVWSLCGRRYYFYYWMIAIVASIPRLIQAGGASFSLLPVIETFQLPWWGAAIISSVALPLLLYFEYGWLKTSIKNAREILDKARIRHQ